MTHYELLQACRTVRDNLGRKGTVSVDAAVNEDYHDWDKEYARGYRLTWTISFHDSEAIRGGASGLIQESSERQSTAFEAWTESMRRRFGTEAFIPPQELEATLDAHRAAESAA